VIYQRPLLIPVLAMVLGFIVNDQTGFSVPLLLVIASGVALFLSSFPASRVMFLVCLSLFFFFWGCRALSFWSNPQYPADSIRNVTSPTPVVVGGVVKSRPSHSEGRTSFILDAEYLFGETNTKPVSGKVMVYVAEGECTVARGDRIRFSCRLIKPRILGLPGEFDYPRYLRFNSVVATANISHASGIVLERGGAADTVLRKFDDIAADLSSFIRLHEKDSGAASVLIALLLGDQKQIPKDLNNAYSRAGVNHILSISGFHVGIIAYGMTMFLLFLATRSTFLACNFNLRRLVLLFSLPVMVAYLLVTGAAPATARSVIMLGAILFALFLERETDGINSLLLAASVLLILNPPTLFDVSFQLSFLALWGIVLIIPHLSTWATRFGQRQVQQIIIFATASVAASLFTLVPVLYVFNQASLNGVLSNFIIVPILGYGAVLLGFVGLLCSYVSTTVALLFLVPAGWLTRLSNTVVSYFASLPVIHCHVVTALDMGLFLLGICAATFLSTRRQKLFACSLILVVFSAWHLSAASKNDGRLHVTMLSVGQGESILLHLPGGENWLIDGGGYLHENGKDFGERTVTPALLKSGVRKLDGIILTHSHPDHLGGLPFVAETMPVASAWKTAMGGGGELEQRLEVAMSQQHAPFREISAGTVLHLSPEVSLQILSPLASMANSVRNDQDMNEQSLVFRLIYKKFSMLFTADAGFEAESEILKSHIPMKSTVLKVGHHGSRYSTSEEFLKSVSPSIALISAGYGNRFGLPSPDTIQLLQGFGVKIYRTDVSGTIELSTDGVDIDVKSPFASRVNEQ